MLDYIDFKYSRRIRKVKKYNRIQDIFIFSLECYFFIRCFFLFEYDNKLISFYLVVSHDLIDRVY